MATANEAQPHLARAEMEARAAQQKAKAQKIAPVAPAAGGKVQHRAPVIALVVVSGRDQGREPTDPGRGLGDAEMAAPEVRMVSVLPVLKTTICI